MSRFLGLRTRLLLAFALLSVITTVAVAGGCYVQARNLILQHAQDSAVREMKTQLETLFPLPGAAPGPAALDEITSVVNDRDGTTVAVYRDTHTTNGLDPGLVPADLRRAVGSGELAWQRVSHNGVPVLFIGAPLLFVQPDHTVRPSGIEVYKTHSLVDEQRSIEQLTERAWLIGAAALLAAIVVALLTVRGVLRPVRELSDAAQRLGEGDLRTRMAVHGTDELAQVAHTFNNTAAELQQHVDQLHAMKADAQRFAADVSHELRTPLAAVTPVADMLDEDADRLPEDLGKAARLVSRETHNLSRLVNDLMEISRFDSSTALLALDEVDMSELVRATLRTRGWADLVHTELPAVTATVDPRRVDVIVANLVGNAFRHGSPPVSVRLRADANRVAVEVRDHGPGLDPGVLPHVFDRFYKADAARTRSEGSGLGMSIAWENASLHRDGDHRGGLSAANAQDGGAVFTLHLPRRARDPEEEGHE